jgi:hypothetical protein
LFIVDFLKIKRLTNLEGFCNQQNNFRHFKKIVEPLKTARDKGLNVSRLKVYLVLLLTEALKPATALRFTA